jgi:hypothetical protein
MQITLKISLLTALTLGLMSGSAMAHDVEYDNTGEPHKTPYKAEPPTGGHASLAAAATNPLANLIQFQIQDQYNADVDNGDGYSNSFLLQPVIPVKLPWKVAPVAIFRLTLPFVTTNEFPDNGREHGFGDTTLLSVANFPLSKGQTLGVGASFVFPTAGDNEFTGEGKWQIGPSYAYINTAVKSWQLGFFGWQANDYADGPGGGKRSYVSEHHIQPLIIKHFSEGWYAGAQDIPWKYDFRLNNWSMPMGPRVGRVLKLGSQPVNIFGAVYYDPMTHDDASSNTWAFKLNMTFLFPE